MMKKISFLCILTIMLVMPFQVRAEMTVPEGFYVVNGQEGEYYAIEDLFDAHTKQHILNRINDIGLDHVYIVLDGKIASLHDFVFFKIQGVPVTANTMPSVPFVDRLGNTVSFPWDEWLEIVEVQ